MLKDNKIDNFMLLFVLININYYSLVYIHNYKLDIYINHHKNNILKRDIFNGYT
jgi:hypothetical protein